MRITLELDDEVLEAARNLAQHRGQTVGQVVSDLARDGLRGSAAAPDRESASFFGFTPLPADGVTVTNELINALRDRGSD